MPRRHDALVAAAVAILSSQLAAQSFADVTATAGLQTAPPATAPFGTGLCCADFDGDGDLDLVVPGPPLLPIRYFENGGGLSFTDQTIQAGMPNGHNPTGVTAADFDNDGDTDVLVANWRAPLQLLLNAGNATFTEVAIARGLTSQSSAYSLTCGDYDRDGWLDVYIANRFTPQVTGEANILYRNLGNGFFQDVTTATGTRHLGLSYAVTFLDYDEDGWPDLYIGNDKGPHHLPNTILRNNGNGTFSDVGAQLNAMQAIDGMGVDFADVWNDGGVDIFCSDSPVDHLMLQWNPNTSQYVDVTYPHALLGSGVGWAVNWLDFDNDAWLDLHVVQNTAANVLFRNPATPAAALTPWPEVAFSAGLAVVSAQHAAITIDLDDDGRVDLINRHGFHPALPNQPGCTVHHNQTAAGNWLKIQTRGVVSNRDGIGARIEVATGALTQRQSVRNGPGYLSSSDPRVHFGLGTATVVDRVTVTWPSGQVQLLDGVAINQILEVTEPSLTISGPVPLGGSATLELSVQGDEGLLYAMVLAFAETPRSQLPDGRFLPLQLDGLSSYTFVPGNVILGNPLGYLDGLGRATSTVTMPNTPGLSGLVLFGTAATVPVTGLPGVRTVFPEAVRVVIQ